MIPLLSTIQFGYTDASQLHPTLQQKIKRDDPAEHSNVTHPYQYTTMKSQDYMGVQRPSLSEARCLGRENVGVKELTGYTENTIPYVEMRSDGNEMCSTNYVNT